MVVIKDDTNIVNLTGELEDNLEFSLQDTLLFATDWIR